MKSIFGTLMDNELEPILLQLDGRILDLASGRLPTYRRFLSPGETDIIAADRDIADFDKLLPFKNKEFDHALCINALYRAADPLFTLRELRRVTRRGGSIIFTTPFIFPEAREPHDYFRWTSAGLEQLCRLADLEVCTVTPIGGPFTASLSLVEGFFFAPLRWPLQIVARLFDRLVPLRYRKMHPYQLGYLTIAKS